jgi:hypothetical protein
MPDGRRDEAAGSQSPTRATAFPSLTMDKKKAPASGRFLGE